MWRSRSRATTTSRSSCLPSRAPPTVAVETLFEGSTPLARRLLAEAPHGSEAEMIERAYQLLGVLTEEEKVATVNAHPRIGEDPDRLSRLSLAEQGADRMPELKRLNA